ncbi:hypothetical protein HYT45_02950 [Candidatus Uhrbacteria bacterium]|nr:hypothetical protein [Candidatus Uhrbacteria bacterium]
MAEKKKEPKRVGVIVFGGGLNEKQAIADAEAKGYEVRHKGDHAELWK